MPLIGRVSMDLTAYDVTDVPGITEGDWIEMFGPNVPIDDVARAAGTIGYELLTGLGTRYARTYIDPFLEGGSMPKQKIQFVCQNCGAVHSRWSGRCDACGEWNSLVEEVPGTGVGTGPGRPLARGREIELVALDGENQEAPRISTSVSELDRVTGGGFVRGSALLVGRRSRHRQVHAADAGFGRARGRGARGRLRERRGGGRSSAAAREASWASRTDRSVWRPKRTSRTS